MTILTHVAGLPISINEEKEDLFYDEEDVHCSESGVVSLREISPALLNKALIYPELVYKLHRQVKMKAHVTDWSAEYAYDVIYLPDGLLGIEYIKTHIFYYPGAEGAVAVIQVISGDLVVMMQKNKQKESIYDIESHVEEALIIEAKQGEKFAVPAGYYYTFVNTSTQPVVFSRVTRRDHIADYNHLRRESGLAYYLIAKNARQEIVINPRYRTVNEIKTISVPELNSKVDYRPDSVVPLYDEAVKKVNIFAELLI
jgi:oxalate decarboxylase/phosphoglucose isomerase-like protein (cupin superfamily)